MKLVQSFIGKGIFAAVLLLQHSIAAAEPAAPMAANAVSAASEESGGVIVTPKHLMVLRPGIDTVWGSYVFAVQNHGKDAAPLKAVVTLPKETVDFSPQEGVSPSEVSLAEEGLLIQTQVPSGVHIISIGFELPASFGEAKMTLQPASEMGSLTLLVPRQSDMELSALGFLSTEAQDSGADPQYRVFLSTAPLAAKQSVTIHLSGIPEGRARLWILGSIVGGLLLLIAGVTAALTRPKITEQSGTAIIVG